MVATPEEFQRRDAEARRVSGKSSCPTARARRVKWIAPTTPLFRVRDHVFDTVGIIRDREKEAPGPVDAGLPNVADFVVLFGRGAMGVAGWQPETVLAFQKPAAHLAGRLSKLRWHDRIRRSPSLMLFWAWLLFCS